MEAIRQVFSGFFGGLLFAITVITCIYYHQRFDKVVDELPIINELTDTYLLGWQTIKELGISLTAERNITSTPTTSTNFDRRKLLQTQQENNWNKAQIIKKLELEGFGRGKMKNAFRYLDYIETHRELALQHAHNHKIYPSIQLAQALLESNAGNSKLAKATNNHFGIKARLSANALQKISKKQYELLNDNDFVPIAPATGVFQMHDDYAHDRFEKYRSISDSYERHAQLLTRPCSVGKVGCYSWIWQSFPVGTSCNLSEKSSQYYYRTQLAPDEYFNGLVEVPYYAAAAAGLKMAGYATSKTYHRKIAYLIDTYELWRLDLMLLGRK